MNINRSLRIALALSGKTKVQVGNEIGMASSALSRWKNHDLRMSTVIKLANAFGLKVSEFIALGEQDVKQGSLNRSLREESGAIDFSEWQSVLQNINSHR